MVAFRGVFVGIDRYRDSAVPWLAGASRDARAAQALFTDTLGEGPSLLVDEHATTAAIRKGLEALQGEATADDIVVFFYAGHGSEDHYLVTFDTDPAEVAGTGLGLEGLVELISAIPAKTMLCVLDCCFSGGFGARVLSNGVRSRAAVDPVEKALGKFAGVGRLTLTASAANEEALESPRHGHGLLTFRFLEALQGVPETRDGGGLSLIKVIEYVIRTVQADAAQLGYTQTPTLRGQFDGAQLWPVLAPGPRYGALFPDTARPPVTADLSSLEPYGFPTYVQDAWAGSIPGLNELQQTAINDFGLLDGDNLVVTAPTSSGKTMVGELVALQSALRRQRAVFLLPMKALVNDKFAHFQRVYSDIGLRTIRATGDHSDDVGALLRGQFDLALLTYEKYAHLALANPHLLDIAATVVVDEAQILADRGRGPNLELLLTLLNNRRGRAGVPQIITLSAVVGDLGGLHRWLGARHLHHGTRPVPLVEGVLDHYGAYHHIDESGLEHTTADFAQPIMHNGSRRLLVPLVRRLVGEDKKVIVFRQSKPEAVACAVYLAQALGLGAATRAVERLAAGDLSTSTRTLQTTLGSGVGFHTADLDRDERDVIETEFRDRDSRLKVVVATPTLAMGVNTPAAAVAIVGLTHPGLPPTAYSVAEYKNMVGRAGRLGLTERGESYLIPEGNLDAHRAWTDYVNGELEHLHSQLVRDGDPRSLMLRVLASHSPDPLGVITEDDVVGFLDSSFAAHQARDGGDAQWSLEGLRQGFAELVDARMVETDGDGYRLTRLGRFTGEAGVHIDSIRRLVHGLQRCHQNLNSVGLVAEAQLTNELDNVYIPVNAKAKNTEVPRWPSVLAQQGVPSQLVYALQTTTAPGAQSVARTKRAAAAAMWMSGMPIEQIELSLTQHMRQHGGVAGAVRAIADRTRDLLPAVAEVLREVDPASSVDRLVARTMLRLELGIPAEVIDLVQQLDVELSRRQWTRLSTEGITTVDGVQQTSSAELSQLLGDEDAASTLAAAVAAWTAPPELPEPLLPTPVE
jgi:replicative superfamily II helicase